MSDADNHFQAKRLALVNIASADYTPPFRCHAISFAVAGDLKVLTTGGDTVVIPSGALAAGIQHSLDVVTVIKTGTAATGIVAYGD